MRPMFELVVARTARRVRLILRGHVQHGEAVAAVRLCLALPASVRSLDVEARDVSDLSDDARIVLLALVRTWRRVRHGGVTIHASEHAVRALGDHVPAETVNDTAVSRPADAPPSAALTAMYL